MPLLSKRGLICDSPHLLLERFGPGQRRRVLLLLPCSHPHSLKKRVTATSGAGRASTYFPSLGQILFRGLQGQMHATRLQNLGAKIAHVHHAHTWASTGCLHPHVQGFQGSRMS
jgi:hypothetical protein